MTQDTVFFAFLHKVSMESGLEGRNNGTQPRRLSIHGGVSMESGLEGRNNLVSFGWVLLSAPSSQWSPA